MHLAKSANFLDVAGAIAKANVINAIKHKHGNVFVNTVLYLEYSGFY